MHNLMHFIGDLFFCLSARETVPRWLNDQARVITMRDSRVPFARGSGIIGGGDFDEWVELTGVESGE